MLKNETFVLSQKKWLVVKQVPVLVQISLAVFLIFVRRLHVSGECCYAGITLSSKKKKFQRRVLGVSDAGK